MKVSLNPEIKKNVGFKGHDIERNDRGRDIHWFYFPYDEENFDCELEVFEVKKSENGDYIVNPRPQRNQNTGNYSTRMVPGANKVDLASEYLISDDEDFAYHFKLREKNTPEHNEYYRVDAGTVVDSTHEGASKIYNIHSAGGSRMTKGGAMILTMADFHNPLWVYDDDNKIIRNKNADKSLHSIKHFSNRLGGTLAGIEKSLEEGEFDPYSRLIMTPFQTGDNVSGHGYWIANAMQMALVQGNLNNYSSLVRKLFAKGKNFVSDAALVNEGLEGIHMKKVAKYGLDSEFAGWFRIQGLTDSPLAYGIFSEKKDFISARVVNSKYEYSQNEDGTISIKTNKKYNSKKPTFVQVYDNRLVDVKKLDPSKIIDGYDYTNTKNGLDINNYNDTIVPYKFEVNPETYNNNVIRLNQYNKLVEKEERIKMDSYQGARFLTKFENFDIENRFENGFDTWDANPDIAKLDYVYSHADTESLKNIPLADRKRIMQKKEIARAMVQDYAVTAGQYWTAKTRDIIKLGILQELQDVDSTDAKALKNKIDKLADTGKLPYTLKANLSEDLIQKVITGKYKVRNTEDRKPYLTQIVGNMMNLPLDAIELGDDISGTFATSYMTKRAASLDYIGKSRYELWQDGDPHLTPENRELYTRMNKVYEKQMLNFATDVLSMVEEKLGNEYLFHDKIGNTTKFGKVVLPIFAQEIAKFAVIKGLYPDAAFEYNTETGEISYKYKKLKEISLRDIGIYANSEKDEARQLISKLESGIPRITNSNKNALATAIARSIKHTDYNTFTLADVIIDKTNAGLDWRIDATKDIADVESLRNYDTTFETVWQDVIDFWKRFSDGVYGINKNSYLVAEITNEGEIHNQGGGYFSERFKMNDIVPKFLRETGITSTADYKWFFSNVAKLFGKSGEDGSSMSYNDVQSMVFNQLVGGGNFLRSGDIKSILFAYNFVDNHDKPRILDSLATDNELFYDDLLNPNKWQSREKAYRIINDKMIGPIIPKYSGENDAVYQDRVNRYITENQDFSRVSSKACARGRTLNSGFGRAIADIFPQEKDFGKNKHIVEAINKSITDLVNGSYLGQNFEAEGFGTKPYHICIDFVLNQAKSQHNLNLSKDEEKKLKDLTFEKIIDPQISKLLGMMKVIVGVPGIPTLFSGSEFGATGYDQRTKNIYLHSRSINRRDWVDESNFPDEYKPFIAKHRKEFEAIMGLRAKPECHAMNDGHPYMLMEHEARVIGDEKVAQGTSKINALLRQAKDGSMTVTLFNLRGAKHYDNNYLALEEYYSPTHVEIDKLYLNEGGSSLHGIRGGVKQGLKFFNAENPNEIYYTRSEDNGRNHYLVRHENGVDLPIQIKDTTLTLCYVPENNKANLSFTGKSKVLYNPQYNFIPNNSNPYKIKNSVELGNSLALIAK